MILLRIGRFWGRGKWVRRRILRLMPISGRFARLRIMRNYLYARHGLPFKSKDLTAYFGQFIWYDPIEGLTAEQVKLKDWEQECLAAILAEEEKRRK
jgi:hypothetical protein